MILVAIMTGFFVFAIVMVRVVGAMIERDASPESFPDETPGMPGGTVTDEAALDPGRPQ